MISLVFQHHDGSLTKFERKSHDIHEVLCEARKSVKECTLVQIIRD